MELIIWLFYQRADPWVLALLPLFLFFLAPEIPKVLPRKLVLPQGSSFLQFSTLSPQQSHYRRLQRSRIYWDQISVSVLVASCVPQAYVHISIWYVHWNMSQATQTQQVQDCTYHLSPELVFFSEPYLRKWPHQSPSWSCQITKESHNGLFLRPHPVGHHVLLILPGKYIRPLLSALSAINPSPNYSHLFHTLLPTWSP